MMGYDQYSSIMGIFRGLGGPNGAPEDGAAGGAEGAGPAGAGGKNREAEMDAAEKRKAKKERQEAAKRAIFKGKMGQQPQQQQR